MVRQLRKRKKNNRIFGGSFFAKLQSVAISQWSLSFFALSSLLPKNCEATVAIKNDHTKVVN